MAREALTRRRALRVLFCPTSSLVAMPTGSSFTAMTMVRLAAGALDSARPLADPPGAVPGVGAQATRINTRAHRLNRHFCKGYPSCGEDHNPRFPGSERH